MDAKAIFDAVARRVGDAVYDFTVEGTKDPFFRVRADRWPEVALCLRDESELGFSFLQNVTAVDWVKQDKIEVVYHLWSYAQRHGCVVKIDLPRAKPEVASVAQVWKAADWSEREQFDLMGVAFSGHPDLRRIMLPDDWPGHPMRKDYHEASEYRGMPTTRPNTLDLLPLWDKAAMETPGSVVSAPVKPPAGAPAASAPVKPPVGAPAASATVRPAAAENAAASVKPAAENAGAAEQANQPGKAAAESGTVEKAAAEKASAAKPEGDHG